MSASSTPARQTRFAWAPVTLTTLRLILGPVVLALAWKHVPGAWIAGCTFVAIVSDIYDGIIARRLHIDTETLRRYDSFADTVFYIGIAWAAWRLHPEAIGENAYLLATIFALEIARYGFDFAKFRREASYHMYSSKVWGLVLAGATIVLFAFGTSGWLFRIALLLGVVCDLEGLAISMVLPRWTHDVPSIAHALKLRRRTQE
ncbi:MAG: CDP-alcohol phosphatidyltransferase family protein [Terriglobales bacterium]